MYLVSVELTFFGENKGLDEPHRKRSYTALNVHHVGQEALLNLPYIIVRM